MAGRPRAPPCALVWHHDRCAARETNNMHCEQRASEGAGARRAMPPSTSNICAGAHVCTRQQRLCRSSAPASPSAARAGIECQLTLRPIAPRAPPIALQPRPAARQRRLRQRPPCPACCAACRRTARAHDATRAAARQRRGGGAPTPAWIVRASTSLPQASSSSVASGALGGVHQLCE